MSISTNSLFNAKNIRIENQQGSNGIYLSWDDVNENLLTSVINYDETYVPVPQPTETMFNYDVVTPAILNGEYPSTGFNYSNIKLMFDGILGTNTSLSGSGVGSYTVSSNYIQFNYSYIGQSDTLTITSFNKLNSKSKPFTRTFNLKQILNLPLSWTNAPNTQGYQYNNLVIAFARNVTAFNSVSSQYGNITNPVLYDTNKIKFDYLTPFQSTDIITFSGINDGSVLNSSNVTFSVSGLLLGPVVSGFVSAPTSQSYPYTGLQVTFSKAIQSSNVSVSHGTISNISGYNTNTLTFNWTTGTVTNQSITFANLVALDGSIDPDSSEVLNIALQPAPHSPTWFENSPVNQGQEYNVKVVFSENIRSPLPTVSNSNSDSITNISIQDGKLLFTVTPSTNSATYTFSNVYGISGGIAQNLTLSLGASLQSVTVNKNLTGSGDDVYSGSNVVKDKQNKIKLQFSKPLQSAPSISGFTYNSNTGSSYVYTYTPTASVGSVLNFETGLLTGSDSTTSTSQSFSLTVIDSQTILTFREQNSGNELTDMDVGTTYNLVITTSKGIDADVSNTTFEGNPVTRPASTTYNTTYTPSVVGTNQTLSIQNAKDIDLFLYTLYKTGLNFNAVADPWSTNFFSSGSRSNYMDVETTFANPYHLEQTILATFDQPYTPLNFNVGSYFQWRFRDAYYTQNNTLPIPVVTGIRIYWESGGNVESIWRISAGNTNGGEVILADNVSLNSSVSQPTIEWNNTIAYEYIRWTLLGGAFWTPNPKLYEVEFKIPS